MRSCHFVIDTEAVHHPVWDQKDACNHAPYREADCVEETIHPLPLYISSKEGPPCHEEGSIFPLVPLEVAHHIASVCIHLKVTLFLRLLRSMAVNNISTLLDVNSCLTSSIGFLSFKLFAVVNYFYFFDFVFVICSSSLIFFFKAAC